MKNEERTFLIVKYLTDPELRKLLESIQKEFIFDDPKTEFQSICQLERIKTIQYLLDIGINYSIKEENDANDYNE